MENIEQNSIYHEKNLIDNQMKRNNLIKRASLRHKAILTIVGLLILIAILNFYSVSNFVERANHIKYIMYFFIGSIPMLLLPKLDYKILKSSGVRKFIFIGTIFILSFMLIGKKIFPGVVRTINGASSWIKIGPITIQPAELLKIVFIILIAFMLGEGERKNIKLKFRLINTLIVLGIFGILIVLQRDLGTFIHYIVIALVMIFLSGFDKKYIIRWGAAVIFFGIGACYYIYKVGAPENAGYKYKRIATYLDGLFGNGYTSNLDIGYQVNQSLLAFGNGGILGVGYGNGVQKYNYLPEIHTDFIMALFAEEMGLIGVSVVLLLFLILYQFIISVALESRDNFGKYLSIGVGGLILTQVLINISVAIGLLPVFGIPMPMFSYGGSSILTILTGIGIVLSVNNNAVSEFDKL